MEQAGGGASLGLYGLGTMGAALALNILEKGFPLHVANRTAARTPAFLDAAGPLAGRATGHESLPAMVAAMPAPRALILMVDAGPAVDQSIEAALPHLAPGDIVADCGNADFHDTRRRAAALAARGIRFLGVGVSGGEEGARHGPAIMAGGEPDAWAALEPVLSAIAARHEGEPCAALLGPDGAGHFVKTVHNGIEYADMQLIAEVYGLLRHGMNRPPAAIASLFARWNGGRLRSYLVEITAEVLAATDPATGGPVVDVILDRAGQKGTGRWTVIEALRLGQSASAIEAAVAARAWSAEKPSREAGEAILGSPRQPVDLPEDALEGALLAGRIVAYAQGFRILQAASAEYGWNTDMARVAETWRAGCIIRSALLADIAAAFRAGDLPQGQLLLSPAFAADLRAALPALRRTVAAAALGGHPVPALSAALAFADTMAQARGTADLIQAQRDYFGRHGFVRLDTGTAGQHGPWAG
ncbi:NADP-dependent phosphogluconate dehydrogenase [Rubellimicrobium sp. CFH 75288]|uniref:NADP-dependent phosphogluconate dehydrogenase n=1 Tax=Rubellimicrobium sp. CFH 75288 TaxID=2697034 RepID=UPI001411CBBC|nr:NADP-dependent phosphogluconate dehydrogenase [Rubellimicrobium sp. CFH 75288]NAZ37213.1 NADP-dependent phosphogluconate dehydrogenase [Rubellimicrobium sp. CFH 75288]